MTSPSDVTAIALAFLDRVGEDCIGLVDSEEKLAAAVGFCRLKDAGLVRSRPSSDGPLFSLTEAGRTELARLNSCAAGGQ